MQIIKKKLGAVAAVPLFLFPLVVAAADDVADLQKQIDELKQEVRDRNAVIDPDSVVHLGGYGSVTYTDSEFAASNASFSGVQFSPIFHYQYKDLVMLESELEIEATSAGETDITLEYLTIDLFLHDYATLIAGKFLSPLGQFRQNYHPAWVNRLASAPPGFGHHGAAPLNDVGLQLRGGYPLGMARANYSVYVANGPELEAVGGTIEAIGTEGFTRDEDGKKVYGGRLGFLPIPSLEIGVSGASGETSVTTDDGVPVAGDPARGYSAAGADLNYRIGGFRLLGEYIQQKVDAAATSIAPEGGTWKAWYTQASYLLPGGHLEGVVRYGRSDTPNADMNQKQTAVGVNWWFAAQVVAKVSYEFNDGESGMETDSDRLLAQLAYGF